MNITVFERSSKVGGRSTTVDVFNDPKNPVELGASIFVQVNKNLMRAAKKFGLQVKQAGRGRPKEATYSLGVWNGQEFVFLQKEGGFYWWHVFKLLWNYGLSPLRTQSLMKTTVNKFLKLYRWPYFPFKSLSAATMSSGLIEATWATGAEFLKENGVSDIFARDIIQAATRVNYGQNLALIHGLETMVCMAADGAVSVEGGNWQLFSGMLDASRATLNLNSSVTHVHRNRNNRTYTVTHRVSDVPKSSQKAVFDQVVIANPLQFSDIKLSPSFDFLPNTLPYVKLHVTLFSSPYKLSPKFFRLSQGHPVPETVLTTIPANLDLGARRDGVGPAGIWSISTPEAVSPF